MKWKKEKTVGEGATRVVRRLIIFPKLLGDEWRCLTVAYVKQTVVSRIGMDFMGSGTYRYLEWEDTCWDVSPKTQNI